VLEQNYEELERLFLEFDLRTLLSNVAGGLGGVPAVWGRRSSRRAKK